MATSIANPNVSNIQVNTWSNVYSSAPVAGFTGTVRIVVELGSGNIKLSNTGTGVVAATGYGDLYNGSATSIAFEGSLTQVNNALKSLQAYNTNADASPTLKISAVLGGTAYNPVNQHYYQYIDYTANNLTDRTWTGADGYADHPTTTFNGLQGYLATITSDQENQFIVGKVGGNAWIGASDAEKEGTWKWVTGPEAGTVIMIEPSDGNNPVYNTSPYYSWQAGEPNDGGGAEDYAQLISKNVGSLQAGKWNDLSNTGGGGDYTVTGFVIEYGGIGTPIEAAATSSSTLTVQATPVIISNGGGDTATLSYAENGTAAVTAVAATDADSGDTKTFSIIDGADKAKFAINSSTGALNFQASPNYEAPTDSDGNNSYLVTVKVTDSAGLFDTQALTVNVTNANDVPTTTGALPASIAVNEDETVNVDLSAIGISDEDPANTVTIKLAASEGKLTAAAATGITVNGSGTTTLTLTGTPLAVTTYLDTTTHIAYTGALNDNGTPGATIAVSYKDNAMGSYLALGSAVQVIISPVNDAPVIASITTAVTLPGIREDQSSATNAGSSVNSLFAPRFTDVDSGDSMRGMVVVGDAATAAQGTWQYSTDSGANWYDIGTVSTSSGLALSSTTQLRFAPALHWNGTPGDLSVKLLDNTQASFTNGSTKVTFDTTVNTASSAASTNAVSLTTSVAAVNDLPTFTSIAGAASLTETAALDSSVNTATGALTGTLAASDVEDGTNVTYGIRGGTGTTTVTKTGFYGTLTLDTATKVWTYAPSNFTAINALKQDQNATDVFDFSITDSASATARQALTITYTGTNDTPLVAAALADTTFNGNGTALWSYQIPANSFTDAEGTNLTYTVEIVSNADGTGTVLDTIGSTTSGDTNLLSNWLTFNEASLTLSGTPTLTASLVGKYFKVTAWDGDPKTDGSLSASDTFTVTLDQPTSVTGAPVTTPDAITPTASEPTIAITGVTPYTENASATNLNVGLKITDTGSTTLASATVTISAGKVTGDLLAFANPDSSNLSSTYGNILATYNATDGQLTLASASSSATLAQWEAALKAVTFYSTSDNPGTSRTLSWQVNDGTNPSNTGTTSIAVTPVNDAPVATKLSDVTHASDALWELDVDGTDNNLFTDAEAEAITYSATLADGSALPGWLNFDAGTHTFSGNPPAGIPYLNLKVIGTDASSAKGETTFTLNLTDATNGAAAANTLGAVTISGSTTLGATLTANAPTDGDGYTLANVKYQWQTSSDSGSTWTDVGGTRAQAGTFTITQAESKQQLRVQALYNDAGGFAEAPVSTALTVPALNLAGSVTVNGTTQPGATLVASLSDGNGIVGVTPTYQWYRGATSGALTTSISGATFSSYTLTSDDGGKFVTVKVTYTDNEGTAETVQASTNSAVELGAMPPVAVDDTGAATEAGGDPGTGGSNATGNVLTNDTDPNASDTQTVTGLRTGSTEGLGESAVLDTGAYSVAGTYGTLSITSTGAYTYAVNQTAANVQALQAGIQVTDAFNYTVTDGTSKSDIGVLTITLTGANDAPVLQNGTDSAPVLTTINEDATSDANNTGNLISTLVRAVDGTNPTDNTKSVVTDVDNSGGMGVAIYATANNGPAEGGKWQYKIGSGAWMDV
ncbi:MAG: VCBS domain-containing protein, partial [Burkholderiaceae bacterium]|nr:VCBS domain-containing protein [Burkholderiaceae bacterium]